jgi:hypothetical protein
MKTRTAFLAFLSVAPRRHDAFLDWHELDHRPENHGGIDHIFHSERFVVLPQGHRDLAAEGPFADPGQYLMTYWSTAEPEKVTYDMATLREQLAAQGRCGPINRDFRATWRHRMHLAKGYASPAHVASSEAAFLTNHTSIVVTVGHHGDDPDWVAWYDRTGVPELFRDERITAAYTLMPQVTAPAEPFVHLHYLTTADEGIQDTIAKAYTSGTGTLPRVLYRATYLAQHAGQPRFYD